MGLRKKSGHNLDYLVIFTMSNENHEELRPCTLLKDSIYFCLPTFVIATRLRTKQGVVYTPRPLDSILWGFH